MSKTLKTDQISGSSSETLNRVVSYKCIDVSEIIYLMEAVTFTKRRSISTRLEGATSQKTVTFI
jgi:hypothetical protein